MTAPRAAFFAAVVLFPAFLPGQTPAVQPDTRALAERLTSLRGAQESVQFKQVKEQLLAWVDARVKRSETAEGMNLELSEAALIAPPAVEEETFAGYVSVRDRPLKGTEELFALEIAVGVHCGYNPTIVFYRRHSLVRLGWLNPMPEQEYGWQYDSVVVGTPDKQGVTMLAAVATATPCNSSWTSANLHVATIDGDHFAPLLDRVVGARALDRGPSVALAGDRVTFTYTASLRDSAIFGHDAIAAYRRQGWRLERVAPVARDPISFIDEWIHMTDSEAARWSAAAAANAHRARTAWTDELLDFVEVPSRKCAGAPNMWEIGVGWEKWAGDHVEKSGVRTFTISEQGASRLRMLKVTEGPPAAKCQIVRLGDPGWKIPQN